MTDGELNFKWLNKVAVESDRGFVVQSVSRGIIEYRHGGRKISIDVEDGMIDGLEPCVIIEPTAFERWDGDSPCVVLPHNEQEQLLSNFTKAMQFQGIRVSVERRFT